MSYNSLESLGQLQRQVLEAVWQLGEASVRQVRDKVGRKRELAYTTILSTMQKLEKIGWLRHRAEGKSYVYIPTRTREQAGANSLQKLLARVFDGDALLMFQHLIRDSDLTERDLHELREMIEQKKEGVLK